MSQMISLLFPLFLTILILNIQGGDLYAGRSYHRQWTGWSVRRSLYAPWWIFHYCHRKRQRGSGKSRKIENYFGLERPLSGHELIENGRTQVQRLGGTLLQDEVVGISWNGNYLISTASTQIEARAIILTTGTSRKTMKIKNLAQLEGHGVSYCAVCDAFSTAVSLSPSLEMASTPFMKSRTSPDRRLRHASD